jgi:hypothetical protein
MMNDSMMANLIMTLVGFGAGLMGYGYWLHCRQRAAETYAAALATHKAALAEYEASDEYSHRSPETTINLHDEGVKNGERR